MRERVFEDADGEVWRAWVVQPADAERRNAADRRAARSADVWFERRGVGDRRRLVTTRPRTVPLLAEGGLAFESERRGERRRLDEVPDDWNAAGKHVLRELLHRARVLPRVMVPIHRGMR